MLKKFLTIGIIMLVYSFACAQDSHNLEFFIEQAKNSSPNLLENKNLESIGELQSKLIIAQNNAFQINTTSEILVAPYFNNDGQFIAITTTPSSNAYGYDVGITNGGLYSTQLNITKNLLNQSATNNLLFQNKVNNNAIRLSSKEITHNLVKNIADAYIIAYQLQLQREFTQQILKDLENRLKVVELLVKKGILMESDYLLLQLDIEGKKLELFQLENNYRTAVNQLFSLSGIPAEEIFHLEEPIFETIKTPQSFFFKQKFENDSLQLVADQQVFENQYKPQLSAYANTGVNAVELSNIEHKIGASAGVRLTIPLYDGNQKRINSFQTQLKQESLENYKQNSEVQLANNLMSIQQQIKALQQSRTLLGKQISKQENILEIYKGKLVQGQISIVDYLNVIQNYKQNIYTQVQMQTNYWLLQSEYIFINW